MSTPSSFEPRHDGAPSRPVQPSVATGTPPNTSPGAPGARTPLQVAAVTSALVTVASLLVPERYAATVVGVCFLAVTWWLVLRQDTNTIRAYGLSLGGLLEPNRLEVPRLVREGWMAARWALLWMAVTFPAFWLAYRFWWHPHHPFVWRLPPSLFDELAGQFMVIALPEEAFFRGYLQTSLDRVFPPRWRILGADLGPGWLLASAIFAVGHVLTIRHPARLAVFFPSLLFGWLRSRTSGVGASVLFHAACNVLSATLGRGYGMM